MKKRGILSTYSKNYNFKLISIDSLVVGLVHAVENSRLLTISIILCIARSSVVVPEYILILYAGMPYAPYTRNYGCKNIMQENWSHRVGLTLSARTWVGQRVGRLKT